MKKSIEEIWKEGFLEKDKIEAPELKNLQQKSSIHLIDKFEKMFKINLISLVASAIVFLFVLNYLEALWQGVSAAILLLALAWYSYSQMKHLHTIDQGLSSYEYLKSFDGFIKNALARYEKIMRIFYPSMFLIAMSIIWFAGNNKVFITERLSDKYPDLISVGGIPLFALLAIGLLTFLFAYFSRQIYRWDVKLVYGRVFKKLEENIAGMEELNS